MFLPPRFVAVDDKLDHLTAIRDAFQSQGADCLCLHFDPEHELAASAFLGVRALFIDLHLTAGTTTSDNRQHFGVIAALLESVISATGGPFVLVLWTEHPTLKDELREYLDQSIAAEAVYARPVAVAAIDKTTYIDLGSGKAKAGAPSLRDALNAAVDGNPQLTALFRWEREVVTAAGSTLASLMNLVPEAERKSPTYSGSLDKVLSRLAVAALGGGNAGQNPRAAINAALAPILSDRIINQDAAVGSDVAWQAAITKTGDDALGAYDDLPAGRLNSMLHVSKPSAELIFPRDWGAVVEFPFAWTDAQVEAMFGVKTEHLRIREFRVKTDPDAWPGCKVRLVRVGAICDYAQSKNGPITYLLGVEMPTDAISNSSRKSAPGAEWRSPVLAVGENETPRELVVNCRYPVVVPAGSTEDWVVAYRLRETLLMDLINHSAEYNARPGYIKMSK